MPFPAFSSFQNNPTAPLVPNGFCDSVFQLFPVDVTSLLEFIFHLCLLAFSPLMSMKDLVPGIKFLLQLNQAKSLTPTEYGDNPLNDLHLFLSLIIHECWRLLPLQAKVIHLFSCPLLSMEMMSSIPVHSPLGCLLESHQPLHLTPDLKGPKFICFCNQI